MHLNEDNIPKGTNITKKFLDLTFWNTNSVTPKIKLIHLIYNI